MDQITPEGAPQSEPVDPDSAETYVGPAISLPRSDWLPQIIVRVPDSESKAPEA